MSYIGNVKVGSTTHLVGSTLYGTCDTAAGTAEKAVTCANFDQLLTGVTIKVKFTNSNTIANPTLNVNNTGAKNIYRYGTTAPSTSATSSWYAGAVISFTYDGSAWMMNDYSADGNDTSQLRTYYSHPTAGANGIKQYSLFARVLDGANTTYSSFTSTSGTGSKTIDTTNYFDIRKIYYANRSSDLASDSTLGDNQMSQQENTVDGRYTFNSITTSAGFTANKPIYMVFDKENGSNNYYKIKSPYWTHTPNDTNALYVLIGFTRSVYQFSLMMDNPIYEYKDSKLVPYGAGGGSGDGSNSHIRYNQTNDAIEVEDANNNWHIYRYVGLNYMYWYKDGAYYPEYTGGWSGTTTGTSASKTTRTINYAYNGNSLYLEHSCWAGNSTTANTTFRMNTYNVPSSGFTSCHFNYRAVDDKSKGIKIYLVDGNGTTIASKTITGSGSGEFVLTGISENTNTVGVYVTMSADYATIGLVLNDCYLF